MRILRQVLWLFCLCHEGLAFIPPSSTKQRPVHILQPPDSRVSVGVVSIVFSQTRDQSDDSFLDTNESELQRSREDKNPRPKWKRKQRFPATDYARRLTWIKQATDRFLNERPDLSKGKWHEVVSLVHAWWSLSKIEASAATNMEALMKILSEEESAVVTVDLFNALLDAWACAAMFQSVPGATQRARQILVAMQQNHERSNSPAPDEISFDTVLHVVCKIEGAIVARRMLAWMEFLYKTNRNAYAQPSKSDYIQVLEAYSNLDSPQAGRLAEAFLRHVELHRPELGLPDTLCYNMALKAWISKKQKRRGGGREAAVHADRILEEMKEASQYNLQCQPDIVTYASVISAWAGSGMQSHAATRAEELLHEIDSSGSIEANTVVLNAVMSAWVKSKNPIAVNRTEEILRRMEASVNAPPDLISYNTHLHALSMHSSARWPQLANRAEALLKQMEENFDKNILQFGPNVFSYNLVIDAFCSAPDPNTATKVSRLLRRLVQRDGVEPDTFSFNSVLAAISKSSMKKAAETAEELLRYMDASHRAGVHPNAKPDSLSFSSVISAYTRSGKRGTAEKCQKLLDEMKYRYSNGESEMKPDRHVYNLLIDCWARSGEGTYGARKAEVLLQEMQEMYQKGDRSMAPDLLSYNAVLNAWARSGTRCCAYQAEKYLDQMWKLYNAGHDKVKPNDFSYNTVINAISKSKHEAKPQKALRMLRKMDKLYQAGYKYARPNEITYTAVLNSCAFPAVLDPRTRRKALDTAIFTLKELQTSRYGSPNQVTYGVFIKACANLTHDDENLRRRVIKHAFRQCIEDGLVGEMVLNYTPKELYEELMAEYIPHGGPARVRLNDLPFEWRCNVQAKDSWKTKRHLKRKPKRSQLKP